MSDYNHINSEGKIVKIPQQAKNAIDYTEKINKGIKEKVKRQRRDMIGSSTEQALAQLQGTPSAFITNLPWKH